MPIRFEIYKFLYDEWKKLQDEFNFEAPLLLLSNTEYLEYVAEVGPTTSSKRLDSKKLYNLIMRPLDRIEDALMFTSCKYEAGDEGFLKLTSLFAFALMENLNTLIIDNIENMTSLREYLRVSLRHEMGHVLSYKMLILDCISYNEYEKFCKKVRRKYNAFEKINVNEGFSSTGEMMVSYYNLPDEKRANELVNLTVDMLLEVRSRINIFKSFGNMVERNKYIKADLDSTLVFE